MTQLRFCLAAIVLTLLLLTVRGTWVPGGLSDESAVTCLVLAVGLPPALPDGAFRSDRRLAALVAAARRGDPLQVVRGEGRQFVAAEDVARTVAVAIEAPVASGTYLCIDREFTSWRVLRIGCARAAATAFRAPLRHAQPFSTTQQSNPFSTH